MFDDRISVRFIRERLRLARQAAAKLGVEPSAPVVIEDAQVGNREAKSAGMKAVAVTTTHPAESLAPEMPDRIEASLVQVDAAYLRGLW